MKFNVKIIYSLLQVFDSLKQSYVSVELDKRDDAEDIQKILGEITGAKTVSKNLHIISLVISWLIAVIFYLVFDK